MVLPFGRGDQFGDVVVAETPSESQGARLRTIRFRSGRDENFVQSYAKGGVDHLLEGFPQSGSTFLGFGRNIGIERQGGSHVSIMMSTIRKSKKDSRNTKATVASNA